LQVLKDATEKTRRWLHRADIGRSVLRPYTQNTRDGKGQVLSTAPNEANYRYDLMVP